MFLWRNSKKNQVCELCEKKSKSKWYLVSQMSEMSQWEILIVGIYGRILYLIYSEKNNSLMTCIQKLYFLMLCTFEAFQSGQPTIFIIGRYSFQFQHSFKSGSVDYLLMCWLFAHRLSLETIQMYRFYNYVCDFSARGVHELPWFIMCKWWIDISAMLCKWREWMTEYE